MKLALIAPTQHLTERLIKASLEKGLWERVGELILMKDLLETDEVLTECNDYWLKQVEEKNT